VGVAPPPFASGIGLPVYWSPVMNLIRPTAFAALFLAVTAHAAERGRYLELVNRAHDSVTTVAVAAAGSGQFTDQDVDTLPGGGGATTLRVADTGCHYDLRVGFRNGRNVVYSNVDVCRGGRLVISATPKDGRYALQAAQTLKQLAVTRDTPW
jgi:hypothetical protein